MPKISYLLATNRSLNLSSETIQSILTLPEHDFELVICAPESVLNSANISHPNIKFSEDDKCTGSAYGFNKAYWDSTGEYLSTISDDVVFPSNFLDILDFIETDFFKNKKFKISNTMWDGGPGYSPSGHPDLEDSLPGNTWPIDKYHPVDIKHCPYSVIPGPFLSRDTVENQLDNHIFHPDFAHHYIDHWLGFFVSKNETFEPTKWRCPSLRYRMASNPAMSSSQDNYDLSVLKRLTDNFIKGQTSYV